MTARLGLCSWTSLGVHPAPCCALSSERPSLTRAEPDLPRQPHVMSAPAASRLPHLLAVVPPRLLLRQGLSCSQHTMPARRPAGKAWEGRDSLPASLPQCCPLPSAAPGRAGCLKHGSSLSVFGEPIHGPPLCTTWVSGVLCQPLPHVPSHPVTSATHAGPRPGPRVSVVWSRPASAKSSPPGHIHSLLPILFVPNLSHFG